ncbi:hypothetical protein [Azospirillum palustre]
MVRSSFLIARPQRASPGGRLLYRTPSVRRRRIAQAQFSSYVIERSRPGKAEACGQSAPRMAHRG